ncbi:stalk domain-containing protein, partial [Peptoniphilus harei]|uniref:stalk domain-containing protein n=2 Tax=Peptoniphilus TaxID=162289 RepID=UPI00290BAE2A
AENDEIKVVAKDGDKEPSEAAKATVGAKTPEENTEAPTVTEPKAGDTTVSGTATPGATVKVTLPDGTVKETKANDKGNWTVDTPALTKDQTVKAVAQEDGKDPSEEATATVAEAEAPAVDKKPLQDEVDKENATKDTDKYKNADKDKKDAYNKALEDAKKVLEDPNASQEDINKAKDALKAAEDALNGKTSDNDNTGGNDGYRPGHGGSDVFDRLFRRHDYTPTYPVKTVVPEKTEAATPVRDTLWYVFHINEFQYEVVRNGVVTKRLMDVTPVIQNGRTMLPLRYVAEALQADVTWDAKTRTATFTKDGLTASIQIDSDEIVLSNGKTVKMDSKPLNINDRILVSVTNVANVFGLTNGNTKDNADQDIEWEQQDKSATIYIRR